MSLPLKRESNTPHQQSFKLKAILFPLGLFYRLWTKTLRITYLDQDGRAEMKEMSEPVIITLWHNRLFLAGEWQVRFRKKRRCYGLISGSRDGAWLETFYGWAGIRAVRGSRNRRGPQATRELIRLVKDGNDAGVTPDGSKGPKYQAKSGALFIARASRSPVALLSFSYSRAIRLNSWDQFIIPLPFSKIRVKTKILPYDELFNNKSLEQATRQVEQELMSITDDR